MRIELDVEGHPTHFVGINVPMGADYGHYLVERCAIPLFQDVGEVDAVALHEAKKDDILVYDSDGKLAAYLAMGGEQTVNLSTPEGYANLKRIILETE